MTNTNTGTVTWAIFVGNCSAQNLTSQCLPLCATCPTFRDIDLPTRLYLRPADRFDKILMSNQSNCCATWTTVVSRFLVSCLLQLSSHFCFEVRRSFRRKRKKKRSQAYTNKESMHSGALVVASSRSAYTADWPTRPLATLAFFLLSSTTGQTVRKKMRLS